MILTKESWNNWLKKQVQGQLYQDIEVAVKKQKRDFLIFPRESLWLEALKNIEPEKLDFVITGSRPTGIPSFSNGYAYSSIGEKTTDMEKFHYLFRLYSGEEPPLDKTDWMNNSALLLNRELTSTASSGLYTRGMNVNSYWLPFTQNVVQRLLNDKKERVFILADEQGYRKLRNPHNHEIYYSLEEGIKRIFEEK